MIRNEKEYKETIRRIKQDEAVIQKQKESLEKLDLKPEEIDRVLNPMRSFHQQLVEEAGV